MIRKAAKVIALVLGLALMFVVSWVYLARAVVQHEPMRCLICGCTDRDACDPPCYWIAPSLCSGCVQDHYQWSDT